MRVLSLYPCLYRVSVILQLQIEIEKGLAVGPVRLEALKEQDLVAKRW
jgi:hypothetical protein